MAKLSAALVLALPLLGGCAASSDAMGEIGYARPPQPRPGYSMVVFVRPSSYAAGELYHVVSDRYGFLGDAQAESWFGAEIPAGQHVFCASGGGVPALRASLAPGRTYFVEVSSRYGFWGSRVELIAIAPRFENWLKRKSGWPTTKPTCSSTVRRSTTPATSSVTARSAWATTRATSSTSAR